MTGWKVVCHNYWKTLVFRFDTLEDAGSFVNIFINHKEPDADDRNSYREDSDKWTYSIEPIMPEEGDETEDDIPESM